MSSLWLGLVLLTLLSLAFIVIPVLRFRSAEAAGKELEQRRHKNVELYEQRLRELDHDVAEHLLEADEAESVRTELQRAFLRDMQALEAREGEHKSGVNSGRLNRLVPLVFALLVPCAGAILYAGWGAGSDLRLPGLLQAVRESESPEQEREALQALASHLEANFEHDQSDVPTGYSLGTLYLNMEDYARAAAVFGILVDEVESPLDQATILGQMAFAQYLAADEAISARVQSTIDRALALNPNEKTVMSVLAVQAFLNDDIPGALSYLRRQATQLTAGSNEARALQSRIAMLEQMMPESSQPAAQPTVAVTVNVDVSDDIRAMADENLRVFVYARNPDSPMPMPVAARDFAVADLPLTVTLDDSMPMAPGMPTLSSAERVLIGARISQSGAANRQSGDFESVSEPFELDEQNEVSLTISDVVP